MLFKTLLIAALAALASATVSNEIEARLIGGEVALREDAKYLVQICEVVTTSSGTTTKFIGTGAFLSSRTIITSATLITEGKQYAIYYGFNNLMIVGSRVHYVIDVIKPPNCDSHKRVNNIALLILEKPVTECYGCKNVEYLDLQILPVESDANLLTVGYGSLDQPCVRHKRNSTILRKTEMTLKTSKYCRKMTDNDSKKDRLLCARPNNYVSTVCSGDEGAPLVDMDYKRLVGVLNYGDEYCENGAPVVYTEIASRAMWIANHIVY